MTTAARLHDPNGALPSSIRQRLGLIMLWTLLGIAVLGILVPTVFLQHPGRIFLLKELRIIE